MHDFNLIQYLVKFPPQFDKKLNLFPWIKLNNITRKLINNSLKKRATYKNHLHKHTSRIYIHSVRNQLMQRIFPHPLKVREKRPWEKLRYSNVKRDSPRPLHTWKFSTLHAVGVEECHGRAQKETLSYNGKRPQRQMLYKHIHITKKEQE